MTEQQFQKKIITRFENMGAYVVKTISTNKRGCPDLLICLDGKFIGIEVKVGYNKASKIQLHNLNSIINSGGVAVCIHNNEELERFINA